ncbi:MAG: phosphatase PAP2 family protein [Bacteroidota bacterium]|nr:phosphatase PAP2 family protein [Bacteroidota bacterium]
MKISGKYKIKQLILLLLTAITFFSQSVAAQSDSVKTVSDTIPIGRLSPRWYNSKYVKESIVPVGLIAGSLAIMAVPHLKEDLQRQLSWNNQLSKHYINLGEDYVRYAPIAAEYALNLCGVKAEHKFIDRTAILAVACVVNDFVVYRTKLLVHETRPDRRARESFPSAHTAMAFVSATFVSKELGYISPWVSAVAYLSAGYVGICRVADNAHYVNDVLMGAAVGMMTTQASYWAYDALKRRLGAKLTLMPSVQSRQTGFYVSYSF